MKLMNNPATLAFYNARKQRGDFKLISQFTGYSVSHISNISYGRRRINGTIADAMYVISQIRPKNSELAKS